MTMLRTIMLDRCYSFENILEVFLRKRRSEFSKPVGFVATMRNICTISIQEEHCT